MSVRRIHMLHRSDDRFSYALCGWFFGGRDPSRITTDETAVTCHLCQGKRDEPAAKPRGVEPGWYEPPKGCRVAAVLREDWEDTRAEWPTWRSAVRAYASWIDDGAPLKSTSAASRFEAIPGSQGGPAQGDVAQRQAERMARIGQAVDEAYAAPFVVHTAPVHRELDARTCARILVMAIAGRPFITSPKDPFGGADRKQYYVRRAESDAAEIASLVTSAVGWTITAGHVESVAKAGGRAVEGALRSRGLVSLDDVGLKQEAEVKDADLLRGWKAIAEWLGVSMPTVWRMQSWDPPLPVRKFNTSVEVEVSTLRAWRLAHTKPKAQGA